MKRFSFNRSIGMVYDDLTGRYVAGDEDTTALLNRVSDRADRNAELYWDLYYKFLNVK